MTSGERPEGVRGLPLGRFRRVVLALSGTAADAGALEQAAALAARLHGELTALLVEDIDVVRLAEHGMVRAFSTVTAIRRDLAADSLRDALRLQAARLRREVEQASARRRVKFAFRVCQGRLLAEVLSAAGDDDLVVIGWPSGDRAPAWNAIPPPPAAIARALIEARARSVMLLHPRGAGPGPVLIGYDAEAGQRALAVAMQVADMDGGAIDVALLESRLDEAERASAGIVRALHNSPLSLTLLHMPKASLASLIGVAAARRSALVVLGAGQALAATGESRLLLSRLDCSVLLVR